jgi:cephalosporin hydroxylase
MELDNRIEFNVKTITEGHHKVSYRGVKAIRCPFDYVLYQMILHEVQPDLIIEIGTNAGGGALYLADLMDKIGHGVIHTIDIVDMVKSDLVINHPRIIRFQGGFQNYDIKNAEGFNKILVIDDGSHLYENVLESLFKFKDLVSIGSYFIVEDGIISELNLPEYHGGPTRAIGEFIEKTNEFIIDRKWCDFFGKNATFNINGFLKKIK